MKTTLGTTTLSMLLVAACSTQDDQGDQFGGSADGGTAGTGATSVSSGSGGDDGDGDGSGGDDGGDDSGGDDGGTLFDTPDGDDAATGGDGSEGCEKIDFLFVVDNSGSMSPHQQNLIDNFGPFIDTIRDEVQGTDHQIMVLDTDACPVMGAACTPTSCEEELGAGQVRSCGVPSDTRYMTSAMDIDTIKSSFQCAANVGDQGSAEEMPMSAMEAALGAQNQANGCNPGFVRDDAVLVVTFISDDHTGWLGSDDVSTVGSPQQWFDAVVATKGKVENVVVLGLVALLSDQSCIGFGPKEADRFVEFVDKFGDHGLVGSVCSQDYNSFFQDAVGLIDTTCDEFDPVG